MVNNGYQSKFFPINERKLEN